MLAVPAPVRLLISIVLTVGVSVALVRLLFPQLLAMSHKGQDAFERQPGGARPNEVIGRFVTFTAVAFVFLSGVSVSQFWANDRLATEAISSESANYLRAIKYAGQIGTDKGGPQVKDALEAYRLTVEQNIWPLMQHAQAPRGYELQVRASEAVATSVEGAGALGASESPVWDELTTAVDDMLIAGSDRIDSVPQKDALALLLLVLVLGILNLIVFGMSCVSYPGLSTLLMSVAAGATGLMLFVVVELCNPYVVGFYSIVMRTPLN